MSPLQARDVPFKFQLCDWTLFQLSIPVQLRSISSKTRSTINGKIRKYIEHCGGTSTWHAYRSPDQVPVFFEIARAVSKLTDQEKLLGAGLPDTPEFMGKARALAASGQLRAYVLFNGARPVWAGGLLDRYGVKAKVRRLIRRHG